MLRLPKINKVSMAGRITNDLELRYTASGSAVIKFGVAVDKSYKDKSGQWQNAAHFFQVQAWEKTAEYVNQFAAKGSAVIIDGELIDSSYEKDGKKIRQTEIRAMSVQLLDMKEKDQSIDPEPPANHPNYGGDVPF